MHGSALPEGQAGRVEAEWESGAALENWALRVQGVCRKHMRAQLEQARNRAIPTGPGSSVQRSPESLRQRPQATPSSARPGLPGTPSHGETSVHTGSTLCQPTVREECVPDSKGGICFRPQEAELPPVRAFEIVNWGYFPKCTRAVTTCRTSPLLDSRHKRSGLLLFSFQRTQPGE